MQKLQSTIRNYRREHSRGKLYLSRKRSVGAPDGNKNRKSKSYQSDNFETEQKTHEVVAKETGVSPATIMRDAAYAEAAS